MPRVLLVAHDRTEGSVLFFDCNAVLCLLIIFISFIRWLRLTLPFIFLYCTVETSIIRISSIEAHYNE